MVRHPPLIAVISVVLRFNIVWHLLHVFILHTFWRTMNKVDIFDCKFFTERAPWYFRNKFNLSAFEWTTKTVEIATKKTPDSFILLDGCIVHRAIVIYIHDLDYVYSWIFYCYSPITTFCVQKCSNSSMSSVFWNLFIILLHHGN